MTMGDTALKEHGAVAEPAEPLVKRDDRELCVQL